MLNFIHQLYSATRITKRVDKTLHQGEIFIMPGSLIEIEKYSRMDKTEL